MSEHFLTLLKTKRLGRWCKASAWVILGLGMLYAIAYAVYAWNLYLEMKSIGNLGNPSNFNYLYLFPTIAMICQGAMLTLFGFIVLYVAGTIFTALAASLTPTQDETEDIVYESIDEPIKTRK